MNLKLNRDWYSIVVYPHREAINDVKVLKDMLWSKVGWYNSRDSEAHVTIALFEANKCEFDFYISYIKDFCYAEKPNFVMFDHLIASEKNGAVVVLPNKSSKPYLNNLFKRFRPGLRYKKVMNGTDAHISIGRKLHPEDIEIAQDLFEEVSLNFLCEKIAIRKFNDEIGQYEVIYEFYFLGNPPKQGQLSLFQ
ncbi:hypothetical protein [Pedobacter borealis]|uniref:hypothetical protein n=1 Tax=Pedobacter borealis TaxID=475254 RepID=UPI000493514F|nr:hypothetical protein [Pedobacter borealis]